MRKWFRGILLLTIVGCGQGPAINLPEMAGGREDRVAHGNEGAYGGDFVEENYRAWFLGGDREIRACIRLDRSKMGIPASVSDEEIVALIRSVYDSWLRYATSKRVDGDGNLPELQFSRRLSLTWGCTAQDFDLTLLLGTSDRDFSERHLVGEHSRAAGLAVRTSDSKDGWERGVIYVSPARSVLLRESAAPLELKWYAPKKEDRLRALRLILLHEFGHVFGNPHVEGTIMESRIARRLLDDPYAISPLIDGTTELALCYDCAREEISLRAQAAPLGVFLKKISLEGRFSGGKLTVRRGQAPEEFLAHYFDPAALLRNLLSELPSFSLELTADGGSTGTVQIPIVSFQPLGIGRDPILFVRSVGEGAEGNRVRLTFPFSRESYLLGAGKEDSSAKLILGRNFSRENAVNLRLLGHPEPLLLSP